MTARQARQLADRLIRAAEDAILAELRACGLLPPARDSAAGKERTCSDGTAEEYMDPTKSAEDGGVSSSSRKIAAELAAFVRRGAKPNGSCEKPQTRLDSMKRRAP